MSEQAQYDQEILPDLSKPQTIGHYARLFFSGFAMGAADIVPGVSGGTMAFILGVYETLINAIKSFNLDAARMGLQLLHPTEPTEEEQGAQNRIMVLLDHLHLRFLIALGGGILAAIIILASALEHLLQTQPTYVFAFFGGLIIASVVAIGLKVRWTFNALVALVIGAIAAFIIVGLPSFGGTFGHGPLVLFISGAIAICAMILPGISGSFILLILGQYDFVLGSVKDRDIVSLIFVALGASVGILIFSRILSWLLKRYENTTVAVLVGFMLGSLRLIIHRAQFPVNENNVEYAIEIGASQVAIALVIALAGFVLVSFIDHLQNRSNPVFRLFDAKVVVASER